MSPFTPKQLQRLGGEQARAAREVSVPVPRSFQSQSCVRDRRLCQDRLWLGTDGVGTPKHTVGWRHPCGLGGKKASWGAEKTHGGLRFLTEGELPARGSSWCPRGGTDPKHLLGTTNTTHLTRRGPPQTPQGGDEPPTPGGADTPRTGASPTCSRGWRPSAVPGTRAPPASRTAPTRTPPPPPPSRPRRRSVPTPRWYLDGASAPAPVWAGPAGQRRFRTQVAP